MTVPSLTEREKPGLSSTLPFPPEPGMCQSCGAHEHEDAYRRLLESRGKSEMFERWRECDEWDKPTMTIVILCPKCAKRLIEPHARLYIPLTLFEPFPGVMAVCVDCRLRDGVSCRSPLAKHNGGPGMKIDFLKPSIAHVNRGRGRGGFIKLYREEPSACAGKESNA